MQEMFTHFDLLTSSRINWSGSRRATFRAHLPRNLTWFLGCMTYSVPLPMWHCLVVWGLLWPLLEVSEDAHVSPGPSLYAKITITSKNHLETNSQMFLTSNHGDLHKIVNMNANGEKGLWIMCPVALGLKSMYILHTSGKVKVNTMEYVLLWEFRP